MAAMPVTPADAPRACPQCAQTMVHLALQGHGRARSVLVEHCAACRLVWFDAMESVQLSGQGWVRLLRELQRGSQGPVSAARTDTLACPACRSVLKAVHNRTRFGRYPALECPQHHGHLHSHSGVLAERGLIRPLLRPELRALAEEQRVLHCFNCGARSDGQQERCSYCDSVLMVIDLPRLAHALLRRPADEDASPVPDGVPLAWACRGCGQALDPSRELACPQCGHPVVAPALLDINPLLDAVDTRLRQAEVAARPYPKRAPRAPRTWRDTGLGALERFGRSDDGDPGSNFRRGLAVALCLLMLEWLFRR
jgi:Transcription factor zinc-finger